MERTFGGYGRNVYYSPEACGFRILGQLEDANARYSFDTVIVLQDVDTGAVYAAHDSGCSCPMPFKDVNSLGDLALIRELDELRGFVNAKAADGCGYWPEDERAALYRKTAEALKAVGV